MPGAYQFKHISGFGLPKANKHPFIKNEKTHLRVLTQDLFEDALSPRDGKIGKKFRKPDVSHWVELLACRHAESTGKIGFSHPTGGHDDNVVGFSDILAGGKGLDLIFLEFASAGVIDSADVGVPPIDVISENVQEVKKNLLPSVLLSLNLRVASSTSQPFHRSHIFAV